MSNPSSATRALGATLFALAASLPALANDANVAPTRENARLVEQAFEAWRDGRGSVFDLLADEVEWTVAGSSPVSGVFRSRQEFLDRAVRPILSRLVTPITPHVRHIVAEDDAVVVIWDGTARTADGTIYRNSYAWHMVLANGRITHVSAFLDTWALATLME